MKKIAVVLIASAIFSSSQINANAQDRGLNGLLYGAGGGALIGQAIGRDTESTLIGTAVGSMLGYMIGSEQAANSPVRVRTTYVDRGYYDPPKAKRYYTEVVRPSRHNDRVCREGEMTARVNGHREKVYGTFCRENGDWVLESKKVTVSKTIIIQDGNRGSRKGRAVSFNKRHSNRDRRWWGQPRHDSRHDRFAGGEFSYRSTW